MIGAIGLALILTLQQSSSPAERYPVVQDGVVTMVSERDLRQEYQRLRNQRPLTTSQYKRLVAIAITLESIPNRCTDSQADAGQCIQGCITWEQHKAEVASWWAAPERRYVPCSSALVGPPGKVKM